MAKEKILLRLHPAALERLNTLTVKCAAHPSMVATGYTRSDIIRHCLDIGMRQLEKKVAT